MAQFMIIDSPEMQREVNRLKTHALANPIDLSNGIPENPPVVGDDINHVIDNGTMRIVYSVEIQPNLGQCHHLSISKMGNKPPHPTIVDEIMKQFGMGETMDTQPKKVWMEGNAVNVIKPMGDINAKTN